MSDETWDENFLERIQKSMKPLSFDITADPTRAWTRDPKIELVLDLDNGAFSGIKLGDSYTALSFLGPCDEFMPTIFHCVGVDGNALDTPKRRYSIGYGSSGLTFGFDENIKLDSFLVYLQPDPRQATSTSYTGNVKWNGKEVDLVSLRNVDSFISIFGAPDQDEEMPEHDHLVASLGREPYRRWIMYKKPNAMWSIKVNKAGRTQGIFVTRPHVTNSHKTNPQTLDTR